MEKANQIVSWAKEQRQECMNMFFTQIDFLGCSELYVEEKLNALISEIKLLKEHLRMVEKQQNNNK